MNDKKHIDRLFQEKFKNFEATPDDAVWENIHNELHGEKRKRRAVPIWWRSARVAALLLVFLSAGYFIVVQNKTTEPAEIRTVGIESPEKSSEMEADKTVDNKKVASDTNTVINNVGTEKGTSEEQQKNHRENVDNHQKASRWTNTPNGSKSRTEHAQKNPVSPIGKEKNELAGIAERPSEIAEPIQNKPKSVIDKNISKNYAITDNTENNLGSENNLKEAEKELISSGESIEDAIAKSKQDSEEEKTHGEEEKSRWNITPNVAPVFFNSLGKGSSIHSQFVNNGKSSDINMSYGISGSYAINDKIKIRAGINKVELGYSTAGVIGFSDMHSFNANAKDAQLSNITFNKKAENDAFLSLSNIKSESAPQFVMSTTEGALEQQFGYIEVPLEIEYNLVDRKIGLNLIGGFSTLFLNNNQIYSVLNHERVLVGEANNINSTSYSANLGLGLNYNVSNSLKLNLEPMFKYQLNTFTNTSGDFRPYFIGVYTGFSFKF